MISSSLRARLTSRIFTTDVVVAVAVVLACVVPWSGGFFQAPGLITIVIAFVAIAVRRILPTAGLVGIWLMAVVEISTNERPNPAAIAFLLVLFAAASVGDRRELVVSGLSAAAGGIVASIYLAQTGARFTLLLYGSPSQALIALLAPLALLGSAWLAGLAVRLFRSSRREAKLRFEAEGQAERAVDDAQAERVRTSMARDVHDIVGHSLAVIIAQADSVAFLDDTARIRAVTATIADTARSSLLEVREVLSGITPDGSRDEPQDLEAIVDQIRAAGITVERRVRGTSRPLDPPHAVVVRRVLQEMLTNALRHGLPGDPVVLRETWRSSDIVLEVENTAGDSPNPGSRLGLDGMRSRLTAVGGTLEAEAVEGVFTARARVPLPERSSLPASQLEETP